MGFVAGSQTGLEGAIIEVEINKHDSSLNPHSLNLLELTQGTMLEPHSQNLLEDTQEPTMNSIEHKEMNVDNKVTSQDTHPFTQKSDEHTTQVDRESGQRPETVDLVEHFKSEEEGKKKECKEKVGNQSLSTNVGSTCTGGSEETGVEFDKSVNDCPPPDKRPWNAVVGLDRATVAKKCKMGPYTYNLRPSVKPCESSSRILSMSRRVIKKGSHSGTFYESQDATQMVCDANHATDQTVVYMKNYIGYMYDDSYIEHKRKMMLEMMNVWRRGVFRV